MASLRFLTGDPARYNVFAWGTRSSTNVDAKFPLANVADGDPGKPFKFADAGANRHVTVDAVMTANGNLDVWSAPSNPDGWTKTVTGTGAVDRDQVIFAGASGSSAKFTTGASGTAKLTQQITVRAGQKMQLEVKIRTDAAAPLAGRVYIKNLRTQKWLHADGTWNTSQLHYITGGVNGSFQLYGSGIVVGGQPNGQFVIEDFLTVEGDTCLIEITLDVTGGTTNVWFDDVYIFPGVDFASVHGHNVEPALPVLAESGFDGASWGTRATMTPRRPSFYAIFELVYHRWYRVSYSGTPSVANGPVWYGEVVMGQIDTALRPFLYGWPTRYLFDQLRLETGTGHVQSYKEGLLERRAVKLEFNPKVEAHFVQLRDEWARRSFGGHFPMIVVPYDSDASLVIQGKMTEELSVLREFLTVWSTDIVIAENAFPTVTG